MKKDLYDKIQESRRIKKFVEDAKLKELDMKFKVGDTVVNLNVHWTGIIREIEKWGSDDTYLVHYENGLDYWEEEKSLTKDIKELNCNMNSKETIETSRCMKESLDTGDIIESQKQSVTIEDESISMIDTIHDLEDENIQLKKQLAEKDEEILAKNKEILDLKLQLRVLSSYYNEVVKKYEDVVNEVISIKSTIVSQSIELVKGCIDDLKNFLYKLDLIKDTQDCDGKYVFEKFIEEYTKGLEKEDE